jgi:heme/copper-type cytochrome/quinol oxidase subunit 2
VLGLGSAFWGIVIGMLAYGVLHHRSRPAPTRGDPKVQRHAAAKAEHAEQED